jgi:hypothetical protein
LIEFVNFLNLSTCKVLNSPPNDALLALQVRAGARELFIVNQPLGGQAQQVVMLVRARARRGA